MPRPLPVLFLWTAAILAFGIGAAHSWLGHLHLVAPVLERMDWEAVGMTPFLANTLIFAWHLTTVAWVAGGLTFIALAHLRKPAAAVTLIWGVTFVLHAGMAFWWTDGLHLAWLAFLGIGLACLAAARPLAQRA